MLGTKLKVFLISSLLISWQINLVKISPLFSNICFFDVFLIYYLYILRGKKEILFFLVLFEIVIDVYSNLPIGISLIAFIVVLSIIPRQISGKKYPSKKLYCMYFFMILFIRIIGSMWMDHVPYIRPSMVQFFLSFLFFDKIVYYLDLLFDKKGFKKMKIVKL